MRLTASISCQSPPAPIRDLRLTRTYLAAMNRVDAIGNTSLLQRVIPGVSRVPALKVRAWTLAGVSAY